MRWLMIFWIMPGLIACSSGVGTQQAGQKCGKPEDCAVGLKCGDDFTCIDPSTVKAKAPKAAKVKPKTQAAPAVQAKGKPGETNTKRPEATPDQIAKAKPKPKSKRAIDPRLLKALESDFVRIAPGTFTMGSPKSERGRWRTDRDEHQVTITRGFMLQKTPVTQAQYETLMGKNPSKFKKCGPTCPVERVTWFDAIAYANAKSKQAGLPPCYSAAGKVIDGNSIYGCKGYRLPTDAEWEYAVRAGTKEPRYGKIDEIAWYKRNSKRTTHPVGQKKPNSFGLYDMLGQVFEWCNDRADRRAKYQAGPTTDPEGPKTGRDHVRRGGSFDGDARQLRAARRFIFLPKVKFVTSGFRLARTLTKPNTGK